MHDTHPLTSLLLQTMIVSMISDDWSLWRMLSVLVSCTDWWLQSVADTWCCTTTPGHTGSSWYNWSVTSSTLWLTVLTSHTLCQHSEEGGLVITLLQSQDTQHCLHHIPLLCHYGNSTLLHLNYLFLLQLCSAHEDDLVSVVAGDHGSLSAVSRYHHWSQSRVSPLHSTLEQKPSITSMFTCPTQIYLLLWRHVSLSSQLLAGLSFFIMMIVCKKLFNTFFQEILLMTSCQTKNVEEW